MVKLYLHTPSVFMAWCLINYAQGQLNFKLTWARSGPKVEEEEEVLRDCVD
jgi:hypothetical protein